MENKKGLWLLPSRRRPHELKRFFAAAIAAGMTTPGVVIIQEDEFRELSDEYCQLDLPSGWTFFLSKSEGMAAKCQELYSVGISGVLKDLDWIGVLADDNTPVTAEWDTRLGNQTNGHNIVSSNDMWQAPDRIHGATVWSLPLVNAVGYLAPPSLAHRYFDDVWETIGRETRCITWDMGTVVRHDHAHFTHKVDDVFQNVIDFREADERRFSHWRCFERDDAVMAVYNHMKASGVKVQVPDLVGISLMLATPCGSGVYDRLYLKSFANTMNIIRKYGGHFEWAEMPFCADIAASRAMLLGAFRRSCHTHLLMVDDDMGWSPIDVVRMLLTGRDFVAAVGMKKCDEPMFAFDNTNDVGVPEPLLQEGAGLLTGKYLRVGGAFVMLTQNLVGRMIQSYPELEFDDGQGGKNHALFDPIVRRGKRTSEDYSFCDRWRAIGGNIYVMPDVRLDHVGSSCWSGAVSDLLQGVYSNGG